jgi:hypothetical protein
METGCRNRATSSVISYRAPCSGERAEKRGLLRLLRVVAIGRQPGERGIHFPRLLFEREECVSVDPLEYPD